jgi:hypothetical protein
VVRLLRPQQQLRGLVIASYSAGNIGNLLLIVIPAVCREDGVRLISQEIESNDSIYSPSRALIGGVQPFSGWWAPVAALYKQRWGPGLAVRGSPRLLSTHRHPPTDLGLALGHRKHHHRRHPRSRCRHGLRLKLFKPWCSWFPSPISLSLSLSDLDSSDA